MVAFLLLLFPDRHLLSRRWRPAAWLAVGWIAVQVITLAVRPGPLLNSDSATGGAPAINPIEVQDGPVIDVGVLAGLLIPLVIAVWSTALASLGVRFHRATGRERDQLKWFLHSATVLALGAAALLPVSIGIAILRHQLYDIDRLVSRTLAYGIFWLLITSPTSASPRRSASWRAFACRSRPRSPRRHGPHLWFTLRNGSRRSIVVPSETERSARRIKTSDRNRPSGGAWDP